MTGESCSVSRIESKDLPISTHCSVLGIDIVVHQQAIWAEVHEGGHKGGLEPDIEIRTWQGERFTYPREIRRELAWWSRRNLFDGAGPA